MKKFHDVGYRPYRKDSGSYSDRYGHFIIQLVGLRTEDVYGSTDTLAEVSWQSYAPMSDEPPYWTQPSIDFKSWGARQYWESYDKGHKVLTFLARHFGFSVSTENLRGLPSEEAVSECKYEINQGKAVYGYDPHFGSLTPEVLVYIGLPTLGIRRVAKDGRSDLLYVPVDDIYAEGMDVWSAKVDGVYLGETLAFDEQAAKRNMLWDVAGPEANRIRLGDRPLKICFPRDGEAYVKAFIEWQEIGMPVSCGCIGNPSITSLEELLDAGTLYSTSESKF